MHTVTGYIVASGEVTRFYVMTVTERMRKVRRGRAWDIEPEVVYEVFGLTDKDDFDKVAHEFAHYILEYEYYEVETDHAVYKLWKIEERK